MLLSAFAPRAASMLASLARIGWRFSPRALGARACRLDELAPRGRPLTPLPRTLVSSASLAPAEAIYPPLFSRSARKERLQAALDGARAGGKFVIPEAEPRMIPGPCGAVMTILRDVGPKTSSELWSLLQERFPGVIRHKRHMKRNVLMSALRNKVSLLLDLR
eukprot:scaffold78320_cov40-Tisochrysis_lutea.AAC.1